MAEALCVPLWRLRWPEPNTIAPSRRQNLWVSLPSLLTVPVPPTFSRGGLRPFALAFVVDNGLNPVWPAKPFHFQISNPEFAFLRFVVYEEDMFSDQNFLAQATFPVKGLKTGEDPSCRQCYMMGGPRSAPPRAEGQVLLL